MNRAAKGPTSIIPSELDFMVGLHDDLESVVWVLIYGIMLRHQESLQASGRAYYRCNGVDQLHGSLSYTGLAKDRDVMMFFGSTPFSGDLKNGPPTRAFSAP